MRVEPGSFFAKQLRSALSSREFQLILLPTEKCNFRCTYCYEDFAIGRMPPLVVASVKRLIANRITEVSKFDLEWFGGEPLLAKDVMLDVSSYALQQAVAAGVEYTSYVTTNGYLLSQALFRQLLAVRIISYQISLDGDAEAHDVTRKTSSGGGSFERLWGYLLALRELEGEFVITLRLHVTRENQANLRGFVDRLLDAFGHDRRFRYFVKAISPLSQNAMRNVPDTAAVQETSAYLRQRLGIPPVTLEKGYICYAARPNSYVIRADGSLAKCTVAFKSPANHVGNLGYDGDLELETDQLVKWFEGYKTMDMSFLACPVRRVTGPLAT